MGRVPCCTGGRGLCAGGQALLQRTATKGLVCVLSLLRLSAWLPPKLCKDTKSCSLKEVGARRGRGHGSRGGEPGRRGRRVRWIALRLVWPYWKESVNVS